MLRNAINTRRSESKCVFKPYHMCVRHVRERVSSALLVARRGSFCHNRRLINKTTELEMTNDLIWSPTIFAIGQTQWNEGEFSDWIDFNEHNGLVSDGTTPLSKLWQDMSDEDGIERMIEFGGRHCYRAWDIGRDRATYIRNILDMDHGSVLEHATINWAIQGVSRSLSLELARHRVGIALSQESQRYVDADDIQFVVPPIVSWLTKGDTQDPIIEQFHHDAYDGLLNYKKLQNIIMGQAHDAAISKKELTMVKKRANEAARAMLPNCTETRFLWTTNMRLLRHFLWLRGGSGADLEIRRMAVHLLKLAQDSAPSVFSDMTTKQFDDGYGVPIIVAKDA